MNGKLFLWTKHREIIRLTFLTLYDTIFQLFMNVHDTRFFHLRANLNLDQSDFLLSTPSNLFL